MEKVSLNISLYKKKTGDLGQNLLQYIVDDSPLAILNNKATLLYG